MPPCSTGRPYILDNMPPPSTGRPYILDNMPPPSTGRPYILDNMPPPSTGRPYILYNMPPPSTGRPYILHNMPSASAGRPYILDNMPSASTGRPYILYNMPPCRTVGIYSTNQLLLTRYKKHYLRVGHFYKSKVTFFSYKPSKALFICCKLFTPSTSNPLLPHRFQQYRFFGYVVYCLSFFAVTDCKSAILGLLEFKIWDLTPKFFLILPFLWQQSQLRFLCFREFRHFYQWIVVRYHRSTNKK